MGRVRRSLLQNLHSDRARGCPDPIPALATENAKVANELIERMEPFLTVGGFDPTVHMFP